MPTNKIISVLLVSGSSRRNMILWGIMPKKLRENHKANKTREKNKHLWGIMFGFSFVLFSRGFLVCVFGVPSALFGCFDFIPPEKKLEFCLFVDIWPSQKKHLELAWFLWGIMSTNKKLEENQKNKNKTRENLATNKHWGWNQRISPRDCFVCLVEFFGFPSVVWHFPSRKSKTTRDVFAFHACICQKSNKHLACCCFVRVEHQKTL